MPSATQPSPAIARPLNRNDARTLTLSALGGALEFYDFVVFVFFAKVLGQLFFPASVEPWLARHARTVMFDRADDATAFANLNTPDDLEA